MKISLLLFAGIVGLSAMPLAANAASVPAPIYDNDITLFGAQAATTVKIAAPTAGNYRFTVTNLGSPGTSFPPFDALGFTIRQKGFTDYLFMSIVPTNTVLALDVAQTYFVRVLGAANSSAFLESGAFNLEVVQVIPIPAAAVLFSSAIFGLVVVARRRNKAGTAVAA